MDELELRIDAGDDAGPEQVERLVSGLCEDLRALGLVQVDRRSPEEGAALLAVGGELTATTLRALGNVVVAYVQRSKARAVVWRFGGTTGAFTAFSRKDQDLLAETVSARAAGAAGAQDDGAAEPDPAAGRA